MRINVDWVLEWLRTTAVVCVALYLTLTCLSLIIAHVLLVFGQSAAAEAIIAPVSRGLQFVDEHWKATLLLISPLVWPVLRQLVSRVTKAGGFEFGEPVALQEVEGGQITTPQREP